MARALAKAQAPLPEMAREYVELLEDGQPDGWGQYIHPVYGPSHRMLYAMQVAYGVGPTQKAIDKAFADYRRR